MCCTELLTQFLPRLNTKVLGSAFFPGSTPSVTCVFFFLCGAERFGVISRASQKGSSQQQLLLLLLLLLLQRVLLTRSMLLLHRRQRT
jgi:hypothetical protein